MRSYKNRDLDSVVAGVQDDTRGLGFRQFKNSGYFVREKGEIFQP